MTDDTAGADIEQLSFEHAQAELEAVVERLEDPHTGLDEALRLWERGEALHACCQRQLDAAAHRIDKLRLANEEVAAAAAEGSEADFVAPRDTPALVPDTNDATTPAPDASPDSASDATPGAMF